MQTLAMVVALVTLVVAVPFMPRLLIGYRVGRDHVTVLLFRFVPLITMRRGEVVKACLSSEASRAERVGVIVCGASLGNRLTGPSVYVRRSKGLVRRVVITPPDPRRAIEALAPASAQGRKCSIHLRSRQCRRREPSLERRLLVRPEFPLHVAVEGEPEELAYTEAELVTQLEWFDSEDCDPGGFIHWVP